MVLYFSATGNTEYIAKEIARRMDDECISLLERVKTQDHSVLPSEKPFIICAPVYVCEMPRFMSKYLKEQMFAGSRDVYFIFTSGGYCGISGVLAKSIFRKKGMRYLGHAEFKMPRNYVANNAYPMLEKEEIELSPRFGMEKSCLPDTYSCLKPSLPYHSIRFGANSNCRPRIFTPRTSVLVAENV